MSTKDFYKYLKPIESFYDGLDSGNHASLPEDWWVVVADVLGSTQAIENGKYKSVNSIGASTIMAVVNVNRSVEIPFVFGGDGATLAVPPCMEEGTRAALLGAQELARNGFGLDLRIGLIPVRFLQQNDYYVKIAKFQISEDCIQSSMSGRGWEKAEELIKEGTQNHLYEVSTNDNIKPKADFSGFECRWNSVKSRKDHKISMLVKSVGLTVADQMQSYSEFMKTVESIYGEKKDHHPLNENSLSLTLNPEKLYTEARVRTQLSWQLPVYIAMCWITCFLGKIVFKFKIRTQTIDGNKYKNEVLQNSDYQKFDGTVKMILDGSQEQEAMLRAYLEIEYQKGALIYGLHTSSEALVTCMIFSYNQKHTHFVDGSNGGYAIAAKNFKRRLALWLEHKKSKNSESA